MTELILLYQQPWARVLRGPGTTVTRTRTSGYDHRRSFDRHTLRAGAVEVVVVESDFRSFRHVDAGEPTPLNPHAVDLTIHAPQEHVTVTAGDPAIGPDVGVLVDDDIADPVDEFDPPVGVIEEPAAVDVRVEQLATSGIRVEPIIPVVDRNALATHHVIGVIVDLEAISGSANNSHMIRGCTISCQRNGTVQRQRRDITPSIGVLNCKQRTVRRDR